MKVVPVSCKHPKLNSYKWLPAGTETSFLRKGICNWLVGVPQEGFKSENDLLAMPPLLTLFSAEISWSSEDSSVCA